jgi:hypothetical protein
MEIGKMAKDYDPTRLVCIASGGNFWPVGDIASQHHYTEPAFPMWDKRFGDFIRVCGEMGGYGLRVPGHQWESKNVAWSYNGVAGDLEDLKNNYRRTTEQVKTLKNVGLAAAVYTQTTDVENEINGLLTYDRVPKLDAAWLKEVNDKVMEARKRI